MANSKHTIKFLCSYGGKILPRYPDGKLRYHGGDTRVLAVDRSITFSELLVKLGELCGSPVSLRCQLPTDDLDALVSITSDEDLVNLIEEYDHIASPPSSLKIRAFLSPPKRISPTPSTTSASTSSTSTAETASPISPPSNAAVYNSRFPNRCVHQMAKLPVKIPFYYNKSAGRIPYYANGNCSSRNYLIHNGHHWQ